MTTEQEKMPERIWAYDGVPANWIDMPHSEATQYIRSDIVDGVADALAVCQLVLSQHYEGVKPVKWPVSDNGLQLHVSMRPDNLAQEALTTYHEAIEK